MPSVSRPVAPSPSASVSCAGSANQSCMCRSFTLRESAVAKADGERSPFWIALPHRVPDARLDRVRPLGRERRQLRAEDVHDVVGVDRAVPSRRRDGTVASSMYCIQMVSTRKMPSNFPQPSFEAICVMTPAAVGRSGVKLAWRMSISDWNRA